MVDSKDVPTGKFAELFQITDVTDSPNKKRGRPAGSGKASSFTKDTLKSAFDTLNMGLIFTMPQYALNEDELKALTVAWYDVIKEYPSVGRYLVVGKKFTVWGQALFTTYVVVSKRITTPTPSTTGKGTKGTNGQAAETAPRSTRTDNGNDRQWQDHASAGIPILT